VTRGRVAGADEKIVVSRPQNLGGSAPGMRQPRAVRKRQKPFRWASNLGGWSLHCLQVCSKNRWSERKEQEMQRSDWLHGVFLPGGGTSSPVFAREGTCQSRSAARDYL
jgi:hypothetical protein